MSNIIHIIKRENRICELAVRQLQDKCSIFEKKYNLSSDEFYRLWHNGNMEDEADFFEWKALIDGINEWEKTRDELMRLAS
ncbi:MAG: hypothetical protein GY749_17100 [Desulfobacteraceae bacterium]|nr:hypothetical protein [Desulfobacteraceae bacterium]